jgi:hypothetical protein
MEQRQSQRSAEDKILSQGTAAGAKPGRRLIQEKRKGKKITAVKQPRQPPVVDLMEGLKRSLKSPPPKKTVRRRKAA